MARVCAGCRQEIPSKTFLTCCLCQESYDLDCANRTEAFFYNVMTVETRKTWKCLLCHSKVPKVDNSNTPIRHQHGDEESMFHDTEDYDSKIIQNEPICDPNVTFRRKKPQSRNKRRTPSDDDSLISPQGHTLIVSPSTSAMNTANTPDPDYISLQQFTHLLQENNKLIISSIQSSLRSEIENALSKIKIDFEQTIQGISNDQNQIKQDLDALNTKITTLDQTCRTLQSENEKLQREIKSLQINKPHQPSAQINSDISEKTMVLHGLTENYWETKEDVINRVVDIFYNLVNINIQGYIEKIEFIGKKKQGRPLKIELISKRVRNYLLSNTSYIKEAGFSLTEYLSPSALQEKRKLIQALLTARKDGHHAVIKDNKLIINGRAKDPLSIQGKSNTTGKSVDTQEENSQRNIRKSTTPLSSPPVPFSLASNSLNTSQKSHKIINYKENSNTNSSFRR